MFIGRRTNGFCSKKCKKAHRSRKKKPGVSRLVRRLPDSKYRNNTHEFYSTKEWLQLRYKAILLYGAKCLLCNRTREDGIKLHVDHVKPRSKYPELSLEITNLQVLCEDCNLGKSNSDSNDFRVSSSTAWSLSPSAQGPSAKKEKKIEKKEKAINPVSNLSCVMQPKIILRKKLMT